MQNKRNRREIGTVYEKKAALWLQEQGYEILETNFYAARGEIDIIAREGGYFVFIEVKYRRNCVGGMPEEAVTPLKQHRMKETARYYLYRQGLPEETPCRFDVVAFRGETIALLQNVIDT